MPVIERRARRTGTVVALEDNRDLQFDATDDFPWFTVCVDHGGICSHPTRRLAERFLSWPDEWCPTCQVDAHEARDAR
jgi:hypothetical protein